MPSEIPASQLQRAPTRSATRPKMHKVELMARLSLRDSLRLRKPKFMFDTEALRNMLERQQPNRRNDDP